MTSETLTEKFDSKIEKKIEAQKLQDRIELRKGIEMQFKTLFHLLESQEAHIDYLQNNLTKLRNEKNG